MYNYKMQNITNDNYQCTSNAKCQKCITLPNVKIIFQMTTFNVHQMPNVKNVQHYQMQNISSDNY